MSNALRAAAGFVIYRRNFHGDIEFLLLQASYGDFHYSPPKGFVKGNETDMETAIRVTKEETGIQAAKDLEIFENFEKTLKYNVPPKGYLKEVHYWVARLINPHTAIKLTADHQAYAWWNVKDVLEYVETKELSSLLVVCDYYLNKTITESTTKE